MSPIRVLPPGVANQIAAGEVIERPASVAKELVENALDAGATRVSLAVEGGGRRSIVVADDGGGIAAAETTLAFERHATSKISSVADLEHVESLGFRGEALASIAAVSRLVLTTLAEADEAGTRVCLVGGRLVSSERLAFTRGTTVEVSDLFFNTPARRKFLKAVATETSHVSLALTRAALSRPDVRFSFSSGGREQFSCPECSSVLDRIFQLFGAQRSEGLIEVAASDGGVRLQAYATPPDRHFATRSQQYLFVNGRPVADRGLSHALRAAYDGLVPERRFPGVFVFLSMEPALVDVNVHPGKHEVRFADPRHVHTLVRRALRAGLAQSHFVPAFRAELQPGGGVTRAREQAETYADGRPPAPSRALPFGRRLERQTASPFPSATGSSRALGASAAAAPAPEGQAVKALGQYRNSFILASDGQGFLMVDQHVAHERILFDKLRREGSLKPEAQRLLLPPVVKPAPELAAVLESSLETLDELGIELEAFGGDSWAIKAVPALVPAAEAERFVSDVLEGLAGGAWDVRVAEARDRVLATVACHAAVKVNFPLTEEKMDYLLQELFRSDDPYRCPHGRTIVLRIGHETIERSFGRR